MKTSQKRAIWYAERARKLDYLKKIGLLEEYEKQKPQRQNNIAMFYKKHGIKGNAYRA